MKKYLLITLFLIILTPKIVKAEEVYYDLEVTNYTYNDFKNIKYNNIELRQYFLSLFNQSNYTNYMIWIENDTFNPSDPTVYFAMGNWEDLPIGEYTTQNSFSRSISDIDSNNTKKYVYTNNNVTEIQVDYVRFIISENTYYGLVDTNVNFINRNYNRNIIFINGETYELKINEVIKSLYTYVNDPNLTEVNLDNYEYVILNLKDYSINQAFDTNLQVKGQIGITPVYNYGQTSKDAITGVKVQDRCNAEYESYTTYPLYILQQDIQNNVVYIIKKCANESSFKFDNRIFDITYITAQNKDDPVITINGQQYHTIPFTDLPSSANENEEENYIPGQSGGINDTGGLDGAIKGIQQKMSQIWDTITYFTSFINQLFSVLPEELRIILVSAFTITITLGLIKIFVT